MWLTLAGSLGALAVALGAFGAHALKARLDPAALATWNTAVLYHLVHAAVVAALALAGPPGRAGQLAAGLLVAGIVIFSGSLYVLALSGQRWLGAVTPLGGLAFIAGWIALAFAARGR